MILNDTQIRARCQRGLVSPFDDSTINPASIDVRVGYSALMEMPDQKAPIQMDLTAFSEQHPLELAPGEFMLISTLEVFNIPADLAGIFRLKSSLAREGLSLAGAEFADPGWHGSVATLAVKNQRRYHPILLWPGRKFAQLILHETAAPERTYAETGRYNNLVVAGGSKDAA